MERGLEEDGGEETQGQLEGQGNNGGCREKEG